MPDPQFPGAPNIRYSFDGYGNAMNLAVKQPAQFAQQDYFERTIPYSIQQQQTAQNFEQMGIPRELAFIPKVDDSKNIPSRAAAAYWSGDNTTNGLEETWSPATGINTTSFEHESMHAFENYLTPQEAAQASAIYRNEPPHYTQHNGSFTGYADSNYLPEQIGGGMEEDGTRYPYAWGRPQWWPTEAIGFLQQMGPKVAERARVTEQFRKFLPGVVVYDQVSPGVYFIKRPDGQYDFLDVRTMMSTVSQPSPMQVAK